ncbi:MAG: hypothetical protein AAF252_03735 [Pseudomonadota bacterium]
MTVSSVLAAAMYRPKPGTKSDPVRRWDLPDRCFFAHGGCHVLAGVYLLDPPRTGFRAERIVPNGPFAGNHIYVTDGKVAFDYRGYVARDRLLTWFRKHWSSQVPGWSGTVEAVRFDLLDTSELNARKMRGPDQFLNNPIPRARAFLAAKDHG